MEPGFQFGNWLRRRTPGWPTVGETQRMLLLSILIGVFAGLLVVCFHVSIHFVQWYALGTPAGHNRRATLLAPMLGAALSVALVRFVFRAAQGSGVSQTKAALYVSDGYIPFSAVLGKFFGCSVSIGSGSSLGPEDPSLQMGSGIASLLGRAFGLTKEHMRLIAPVGAAAGIAAAFNTPITAVLFAIEEVVASWNAAVLGSIVLAAVSAVVVSRWFLGNEPLFRVPAFELTHPSELLVYAAMGLVGGLLAVLFVRWGTALRQRLEKAPRATRLLHPVAAGLLIGCAGLWLPQIMGAGYESVDAALHDQFSWKLLLTLSLAKLLATLVCFGAGIPGGMFAPTLFTGAMLGGGLGGVARLFWPFPTSSVGAYVLVGMGTFFAGVFRAPMTSIFMVFEVSASYVIILPVMIANTIAYLLSRQLQPVPFFDLLARQEGMELPSPEEQRETRPMRVEDAMEPGPFLTLPADAPVEAAFRECDRQGMPHAFVWTGDDAWGRVDRESLEAALEAGKGDRPLQEVVALEPLPRVYRDLSLDAAMRLLGPHPVLPVLSRAQARQILGIVTLSTIHRCYGIQLGSGAPSLESASL